MPYPQDGGYSASSLFIATQRPPAGSHLSAWLHGDSAIVREHLDIKCRPTGKRKPIHARSVTTPVQRLGDRSDLHAPRPLRPRASTMSVIDPVQSSTLPAGSQTMSTSSFRAPRSRYNSTHPAFEATGLPPLASGALQDSVVRKYTKNGRHHHHHHYRHQTAAWEKQGAKPRPMCFPNITNRKIRQKSVGTLISGTLLMLVLTTYLALALSATVPTTTFHALFIFFILLLTIIFSHFLIRLCMLAFRAQPRWQMLNSSRHTDATITALSSKNKPFSSKKTPKSKISKPLISPPIRIATPRTPLTTRRPIRLLPPYDDEAEVGLETPRIPPSPPPQPSQPSQPSTSHSHFQSHIDSNPTPPSRSSNPTPASERPLPTAPPPAYGRWRDSIRIPDPEHTDLQQLTRELAMAEAGWSRDHRRHDPLPRPRHLWSRTRHHDDHHHHSRRHHHHHHRRNGHGHGSSRSDASGAGQRSETTAPPSYTDGIVVTSDVSVVGEGGLPPSAPPRALAPAPLFTARGR